MITSQCKESLTKDFIDSRLKTLKNKGDLATRKFVEVYGEKYTEAVISWFERAKNDIV